MAKFLKSIFQNDKKSSRGFDKDSDEDRSDFVPPLDGAGAGVARRKLSISRSGRMKQNKKRLSLSTELYGETFQAIEKPTSKEYHVHGREYTKSSVSNANPDSKTDRNCDNSQRRDSLEIKTPEEEIDSAFEIIDKS